MKKQLKFFTIWWIHSKSLIFAENENNIFLEKAMESLKYLWETTLSQIHQVWNKGMQLSKFFGHIKIILSRAIL